MDESKDLHAVERVRDNGKVSSVIIFGPWKITFGRLGFRVKNEEGPHEYHFRRESNGWITGVMKNNASEVSRALNSLGAFGGLALKYDQHDAGIDQFAEEFADK